MVGCPHFYLFVSLKGVRSCGADIGLVSGGGGALQRGRLLQGESCRQLANKLASDGVGGGGGGNGAGRGGDSFNQA